MSSLNYITSKGEPEKNRLLPTPEQQPSSASLKTLFQNLSTSDYLALIIATFLTIFSSAAPVIVSLYAGELISTMSDDDKTRDDFYEDARNMGIALLSVGILSLFTSWGSFALFTKVGAQQEFNWKTDYYSAVLNKPIKWFEKRDSAAIASSIVNETDSVFQEIGQNIITMISGLIVFLSSWILVLITNPFLCLIAIAMLPFQLAAGIAIHSTTESSATQVDESYKTAGEIAAESLGGIKTVLSLNAQNQRSEEYRKALKPLQQATTKLGIIKGAGWGCFFAILYVSAGVFYYISAWLEENELEIWGWKIRTDAKEAIIVFLSTSMSSVYVGSIIPGMSNTKASQAAAKMDDFIKNSKKTDGTQTIDRFKGDIEFSNVCFSYPTNKQIEVLKGISFKVEAGRSLALVGENGSGKSTIIQLIEGFYYATSGVVRIDGIDIRKLDLKQLRKHIALVNQDPILFETTINENISLGMPDASETDIKQAVSQAEIASFIEQLPEGYSTRVGLSGLQLSLGQRQSISIARALVQKPEILILDEATSSLDVHSGEKVQDVLNQFMCGRTTVIVTQKLSRIKNAHSIAVVHKGVVVECGSYEFLVESQGMFLRMLEMQNKIDLELKESDLVIPSIKLYEPDDEGYNAAQHEYSVDAFSVSYNIFKAHWVWLIIGLLGAICVGATFPLFGYLFADDMNSLLGVDNADKTESTKSNLYLLSLDGFSVILATIILSVSLARIRALYSLNLRYKTFKSVLYNDPAFFDSPETSNLALSSYLVSECDEISKIGSSYLLLRFLIISASAFTLVICYKLDQVLGAFVSLIIPILIFLHSNYNSSEPADSTGSTLRPTTAIASDSLTNIKTVNSINQRDYFNDLYIESSKNEKEVKIKSGIFNGFKFGAVNAFTSLIYGATIWIGAARVKYHHLDDDELLTIFFTVLYGAWSLLMMKAFSNEMAAGVDAAKKIFGVLQYKPQIGSRSEEGDKGSIVGMVEFVNVVFQYKSREKLTLNNINFLVKPGTSLGIIGTNGSGKSTIAQLLMRFYDPNTGEILLDSKPLKSYNVTHLREVVAWVSQEPLLFKGSIMLNLTIARPGITENESIAALTKAQALDVLENYGLDREIGLNGSLLSAGQKQRVAIARSLARSPKVIILDEATSALDLITEAKLQSAIMNEELTLMFITQRRESIKHCDRIILIEKGIIVETGSHESLLGIEGGIYASLFNL